MSHYFKDGAAVKSITFEDDETTITAGSPGCASMEISMEPGHMSMIPFVKVNFYDGSVGMVAAAAVFVVMDGE